MKSIVFRLTAQQWTAIHADLRRPHPRAHERLGLLGCELATAPEKDAVLLPVQYEPLLDGEYEPAEDDPTVLIGSAGIRHAMGFAYRSRLICLYVHVHAHYGIPQLSPADVRHGRGMISDLLNASRASFHGFFVLSLDAVSGLASDDGVEFSAFHTRTTIQGRKMVIR
jgi:hypothetical protein